MSKLNNTESKPNTRRKPTAAPQVTENEIMWKDIVLELITKSSIIGEFHGVHKKNQKNYENRQIQKEWNFISKDLEFSGALLPNSNSTWRYISKLLGKIISWDSNAIISFYSFDTKENYTLSWRNFYEKDLEIISCEWYENETTAESKLWLLHSNYTFCTVDLILLLNEDTSSSLGDNYVNNPFVTLANAKSHYFNWKPYLNLPLQSTYVPNNKYDIKILSLPYSVSDNCYDVVINYTQIANRVLVFNFKSFSLMHNYVITPEQYSWDTEQRKENWKWIRKFITLFFSKKWSWIQIDLLIDIVREINANPKKYDNYKMISLLLCSSDRVEKIDAKNSVFYDHDNATPKEISANVLQIYTEVIIPWLQYELENQRSISIYLLDVLNKIMELFNQIYVCSLASSKSDLTLITGKFKVYQKLFLQCYNRGIILKSIFEQNDKKKKGYLPKTLVIDILQNLPLGLTNKDIDEILSLFFIIDENNNFMYNYLFFLHEEQITRTVFSWASSILPSNRFQCGYFTIGDNKLEESSRLWPLIKRRESFEFEPFDTWNYPKLNKINDSNTSIRTINNEHAVKYNWSTTQRLIDFVIDTCYISEIKEIVYIQHWKMLFTISPYSKNISIFKIANNDIDINETSIFNYRQIEKIGEITIQIHIQQCPLFLAYLKHRNVLITQYINYDIQTKKVISCDWVLIDIYKDILSVNYNKKYLEVNLVRNKNIIGGLFFPDENEPIEEDNNICNSIISTFTYWKGNELFVLSSKYQVVIINPKSKQFELSFKISSTSGNNFANICKNICESSSEKTGDLPFKILNIWKLKTPLEKVWDFSLINDMIPTFENKRNYSTTDWVILWNQNNELFSYSVNQQYIKLQANEVDYPIPKKDLENLFKHCVLKMNNSMSLYRTKFLCNWYSYYSLIDKSKSELVQHFAQRIKQCLLYNEEWNINTEDYHIQSIHDFVCIIKTLNWNYDSDTLLDLFPRWNFEQWTFDSGAEYFQTELFPKQNDAYRNIDDPDNSNWPKREMRVNNDWNSLQSHTSVFESGIKKFTKYFHSRNIKVENIFSKIDEKSEDIIDSQQFLEGCHRWGWWSDDENSTFMQIVEVKAIFKRMDTNNANCVTKEEYLRFLKRFDFDNLLAKIKLEKSSREANEYCTFNYEIFPYLSPNLINTVFNTYLSNRDDVPEEMFMNAVKILVSNINEIDIITNFPNGIIFKEHFLELLSAKNNVTISPEQVKTVFEYIDKDNWNCFIYVSDWLKYYPRKQQVHDQGITQPDTKIELKKLNEDQYLLVLISIFKKLIKFCLFSWEIAVDDFTELFLMSKRVNKNIVILESLPSKVVFDKIAHKIHLTPFEQKILFNYYIDIFNFGLLFRQELKNKFDGVLSHINDTNIFNFETYDQWQNSYYLNDKKRNLSEQSKYFSKEAAWASNNVFDSTVLQLMYHGQKLNNMKDMTLFFSYLKQYDSNNDSFLSPSEFNAALKHILPGNVYCTALADSLINQCSEYITFTNEATKAFISIPRWVLFLIYTINKVDALTPMLDNDNWVYSKSNEWVLKFNKMFFNLSMYNNLGTDIESYSGDYWKLIREGRFSGMIIINKNWLCEEIIKTLNNKSSKIHDYINMYMNISNRILIQDFNSRIKGISEEGSYDNINASNLNDKEEEIDYSKIEIPIIRVNIIDGREMINKKRYQCMFIENFDFFHQELNCVVNITKLRKSFLLTEISTDGQNLWNHIEYSLKVNHYLQQQFYSNKDNNKEDFPFIRNYGIYTKEVIIDKKVEEEIYIVNEKNDTSSFMSLYGWVKSNGGLLQIPELANTDMAFYILRFWGEKILNLLKALHSMNIAFRYFSWRDFYISNDEKKIKMRNLWHYSFTTLKGDVYNGPDLSKIMLILDQLPSTYINDIQVEKLNEIYDNSYLAPEFFISPSNTQNNKIDSWLFGVLMFNILYGMAPTSFYSQLKTWCDKNTNLIFDKIVTQLPNNIISDHFFYNPFSNITDIIEDEFYFTKVVKLKSYSAVVKEKYLNLSTENSQSINGWGILLDMINACLAVDYRQRPSISTWSKCDLFVFDQYEWILCNKFLENVLNYYSPEIIIEKNMLLPLRSICVTVIKNQDSNLYEINNYENFVFNTIREINTYLFSKEFSNQKDNGNEERKDGGNIFVKNPEYYFKNSMIIKSIIDNKIFDLLIFLVLRHFTANLKSFKQNFIKSLREEIKVNSKNLDDKQWSKLYAQKRSCYNKEMTHNCGRLMIAMCDLLSNCVRSMTSYDHMLTLYVEDILVYIIKLFIGEENQLLGDICDQRDSGDQVKKYLLLRTFARNEQTVWKKNFEEDELDRVYTIMNENRDWHEVKNIWCPEWYLFTIPIFKEAFGENCIGNYNHIVIKNYFTMMNNYEKNLANKLENPFINNNITQYISTSNTSNQIKIRFSFINTDYVNEILALSDCSINIISSGNQDDNDPHKNLVNKKNALSYINTIFKGRNEFKIRACLDFKVHYYIQSFLFTNSTDYSIKQEVLNILKEVSISLADMNEISWWFGNNYSKIFNNTYKTKSDMFDVSEAVTNNNWDSNFSWIDFMNKLLSKPHSFVLYFTDRFLGINLHKSTNAVVTFMKEFGLMFSSPLCWKPWLRTLMKTKEHIYSRQACWDILFNLLMSNNPKIISNFNMTMCNFYEVILQWIASCVTLPAHWKAQNDEEEDLLNKARVHFKDTVKSVVHIIIEWQNPYIKTQMFRCPNMIKYMEQNKWSYVPRLEIDEIENEFKKTTGILVFNDWEERIIFWINAFKCWVFHCEENKLIEHKEQIHTIMASIQHIFSNEWSEGLKYGNKNCWIFNIVKLYEWLVKKHHTEFLFPYDNEGASMQMFLSLLTKIRETNINMKNIMIKINTLNLTRKAKEIKTGTVNAKKELPKNPLGDQYYTLQKIYNFLSIKMFNIITIIFSAKEEYYLTLFNKIKVGTIFSELLRTQYEMWSWYLNEENLDISILDNYMIENRLRLGFFDTWMGLTNKYDSIKLQFLQSEFIQFMFSTLIYDFRHFKTDYKRISLEFLVFKDAFPLRIEAISFMNIIMKKYNDPSAKTEIDSFIYDEMIRNTKITHWVQNELSMIKNKIRGKEVMSVMSLFEVVLLNKDKEIIKMIDLENAKDYFWYAIKKDTNIKKVYPVIVDYVNKWNSGMSFC